MNPRQALQLADQRQADLRGDRPRGQSHHAGSLLNAVSLRAAVQLAAASAVRARKAAGWFLVEVGLRLSLAGESPRKLDSGSRP